jgi:NAD(P)-dependent dehydrogenase (short-subunit alcohol dehydrogenase family)
MTIPLNSARYDFTGRVAVVTGGAQGIGAAIVHALRRAGARVAIWDLNIADAAGGDGIRTDVTDPTGVERSMQETLARFGRVDIVVNNAGYAGSTVPLEEYDPAEWRKIIDINLNGTFNVTRRAVPILKANRWGRIVNIASLAGKEGTPNASAYSAAKAGVLAMTKSLGKELAGSGVLANAIAPAAIKTPLLNQMSPEHVETMIRKSPLARLGEPEEVSELTLWLCSDSCTFSTGAIFDLSGGRATY